MKNYWPFILTVLIGVPIMIGLMILMDKSLTNAMTPERIKNYEAVVEYSKNNKVECRYIPLSSSCDGGYFKDGEWVDSLCKASYECSDGKTIETKYTGYKDIF